LKLIFFFPWLEYLLTSGDVICILRIFKIPVNTNWPNDPKIGYKFSSNLVEFLERDIDLKEKLKEFKSDFQRDEVVEV